MAPRRHRVEALGSLYKARLRGLTQPAQASFAVLAEGFNPTVLGWRGLTQPAQAGFVMLAEGFNPTVLG